MRGSIMHTLNAFKVIAMAMLTVRHLSEEVHRALRCIDPVISCTGGVRTISWTCYIAIPRDLRCSTGLIDPSEILIRASLYQRM